LNYNQIRAVTKCKCNAGGRGVPTYAPCSTTANPSSTVNGPPVGGWCLIKAGLAQWQLDNQVFQIPALHLHQPLAVSLKKTKQLQTKPLEINF